MNKLKILFGLGDFTYNYTRLKYKFVKTITMSNLEKHLISKKESKLLALEYEKSNYEAINQKRPADKPDSKVYIYELEVLQDYINLIRDGMEKKGIKSKGIKITLGKYPEHDSDMRLNPLYKGYQTIFFRKKIGILRFQCDRNES